MSNFDNTNRGSIWKNERKTKDTHPDFTGTLNVEGREYFFDAWKRKEGAPAKAPALSFKIKAKDDVKFGGDNDRHGKPKGAEMDLDDSIPF